MNSPLVSIITPTFNDKATIKETVTSVINQTYQNWEMIIIDDKSTEEYRRWLVTEIETLDSRITIVLRGWNAGAAVTRNRGIEEAKGDFIAFLDADDLWKPNKLEIQINQMIKNNWPFTYTSYNTFSDNKPFIKIREAKKSATYHDCLGKNPIGCLTAIYNCKILGKIYMPNIAKRQDLGLWLNILKHTDTAYGIDTNLADYRVGNSNSISGNKFQAMKYQWRIYREVEKISFLTSVKYLFKYTFKNLIDRI